jgi:glutaredoxin
MKILLFTQSRCLSCELMKVFLEAKDIPFEERDTGADPQALREMLDEHGSRTTPTLVFTSGEIHEVIVGFDPDRLDQLLAAAPSSDSAIETGNL